MKRLLPQLLEAMPQAEIVVVDDGSEDDTASLCNGLGVKVVSHHYRKGNGAAVKTGVRSATGKILLFMDADGQHDPNDIPRLLEELDKGFDMVVGAREPDTHASIARRFGNFAYNRMASYMTGQTILDLTSGFRVVTAARIREFLYLLPNGFSYPTTSTMAFFRSGYSVAYVPIRANRRQGKSHISLLTDGARFLLIIFRVGTLYSPLKVFFPVSLGLFFTGLSYYGYTFFTMHRFTNMSALLFVFAIVVFMIGLVSEQITNLLFRHDH